jgi:hypothetical protein
MIINYYGAVFAFKWLIELKKRSSKNIFYSKNVDYARN